MVAASSLALSLVTSTPRLASTPEPSAMLTVNMVGMATGTDATSNTPARGNSKVILKPANSANMNTTKIDASTIMASRRATRAVISSMWSFGLAC